MSDNEIKGLRAVAHPVRLRILSLLTGAAMSAAEVAGELDLTHANASYHLRILLESGEIVEAQAPTDVVDPGPQCGSACGNRCRS